jgi:hypothetical protein
MTDKVTTALTAVALVRAALAEDEAATAALLPPDADTRAIAISCALLAAGFAGLLAEACSLDEVFTVIIAEVSRLEVDEQ